MQIGNNNNNNNHNWQSYLQHDGWSHGSPSSASNPQQHGQHDVYTSAGSSSLPSGIQHIMHDNPEMQHSWNNLSTQDQQDLDALFSGQGTHAGPTGSSGFASNWHQQQDYYDGSQSSGSVQTGGTQNTDSTQYTDGTQNTDSTQSTSNTDNAVSTGSAGAVYGEQNPGANDPSITLKNDSSTTRYYYIQASAGSDPENLNNKVIAVPPGSSATLNPGVGFNGAITDNGTNSTAACLGTRMEFNASGSSGVFYDADTQYGNTNATFGATDGSGVLEGDGDLQHYITAGAVQGQSEDAADKYSDKSSTSVSTNKFTLTSLDYKPGTDGGNDYNEADDPNKIYGVDYANGDGSVVV